MTTNAFENCLDRLHVQIHMLQDSEGLVSLDDSNCDAAQALLEQASEERDAGDNEAAWASLVDAANAIGHIRGLTEASYLKTPEYEVRRLLGAHGSMGGAAKGRNGDQKRLEVVSALVNATPSGGWASKAQFDLEYHGIVGKIKGFRNTEHQRRKIMAHPEIRAMLPRTKKRRRL